MSGPASRATNKADEGAVRLPSRVSEDLGRISSSLETLVKVIATHVSSSCTLHSDPILTRFAVWSRGIVTRASRS